MKFLLALASLYLPTYLAAQSEAIINQVTIYIAEGKYNDAERYTDSLIKIDPKNIDALMMKGNVLLNYSIMQSVIPTSINLADESIYSTDIPSIQIATVPAATAQKVETLWQQCRQLDTTRRDLLMGLCSLYGRAAKRQVLLASLRPLAAYDPQNLRNSSTAMADYASLLYERGDKAGAAMIYDSIERLYPNERNIKCSLAGLWYADGRLSEAARLSDAMLQTPKPDMALCGVVIDVYTASNQPKKVLNALQIAARDTQFRDYPFYSAIYAFSKRDKKWKTALKAYLTGTVSPTDSNLPYRAAKLMTSADFIWTEQTYEQLLSLRLNDFYSQQLSIRAAKDFKNSQRPYLTLAQIAMLDYNYPLARKYYHHIDVKQLNSDKRKEYLISSAFASYASGDYQEGLKIFAIVGKEKNPFLITASQYFRGRCYQLLGDKNQAIPYFKSLISGNDETKYGYLSKIALTQMMGERK